MTNISEMNLTDTKVHLDSAFRLTTSKINDIGAFYTDFAFEGCNEDTEIAIDELKRAYKRILRRISKRKMGEEQDGIF